MPEYPTGDPTDSSRVASILNLHKEKNFVQRVLNPSQFPTMQLGQGVKATHLMGWANVDGKYIVYPTIIQDKKTKKLKQLSANDAVKYAMDNNEYIPFDDSQSADWFSKNYKSVWNK